MKQKGKKQREKERGGASYSESVRAIWFCYTFKLGFVKLICKAFLIFKSNLELAFSIISEDNYLSQSMLWWSVHV